MSSKDELLENYTNSVKQLFRDSGINEQQFERIYFESLAELERSQQCTRRSLPWRRLALILLVVCCIYGGARPAYRRVVCCLQEYIYPGLRLLRHLSVPLIATFPALTELYDETCLLQNPLFRVADMECWPCKVPGVLRVAHPPPALQQHHSAPFVYKTKQQRVKLKLLQDLFEVNAAVFERDASKVTVNDKKDISPREMFNILSNDSLLNPHVYSWRLNRIAPAQKLRKLISRPDIIPQRGQSTERFILIDSSSNGFHLPDPECNFAYLLQLNGDRVVELIPAQECASFCAPISVVLEESYLLWYNWWYWRPVLQAPNKNGTSIAYMGSYCLL